MAWISLVLAGMSEVFGVAMINRFHKKRNFQSFATLILGFAMSFAFLSYAMKSLEMGTAYAIWTGLGTVGSAVMGMVVYGESKDWKRVAFIAMVLCATVGLKFIE